jgi:hypothetical protein
VAWVGGEPRRRSAPTVGEPRRRRYCEPRLRPHPHPHPPATLPLTLAPLRPATDLDLQRCRSTTSMEHMPSSTSASRLPRSRPPHPRIEHRRPDRAGAPPGRGSVSASRSRPPSLPLLVVAGTNRRVDARGDARSYWNHRFVWGKFNFLLSAQG